MAEQVNATEVSFSMRDENALSPEDLAWVDSCLTDVPEDSDNNGWATLRDALTEVTDNYPELCVPSSTRTRFLFRDEDMAETESSDMPTFGEEADSVNGSCSLTEEVSEILSLLRFEPDPSEISLQEGSFSTHDNSSMTITGTLDPMDTPDVQEDVERAENGSASGEEAEPESLLSGLVKDDLMGMSIQDNVADPFDGFNIYEGQIKLSPLDIFRVWDLEIPEDKNEEDEFE
ncbi:PREDICTED: uncharacterized protein LOC104824794 [Tarenaya hassleriana]|uniref:uncharacterized protein LOC104824794 n=1 Tax=Tarenaya hassleriana TaxID=28532 RepID=UPI0008FD825F|nr:PREDICTED: uncharacterized protein LOC104824794 [Tarenaya hassleriana]